MKNIFYVMATAALVLSGCAQEEINAPANNVLVATIGDDASRITIGDVADGSAKITWNKGDAFTAVKLTQGKDVVETPVMDVTATNYKLQSGEQSGNGVFASKTSIEGLTYAIYPAVDNFDALKLRVEDNKNKDGFNDLLYSILPESYSGENLPKLPMFGYIKDGHLQFKHVVGVLKVVLNNLDAKYARIKVEVPKDSDPMKQLINGYHLNLSDLTKDSRHPKLMMDGPKTKDNPVYPSELKEKTRAILCNRTEGQTVFYFPLPEAVESAKYPSLEIYAGYKKDADSSKHTYVKLFKLTNKEVVAGKIYAVTFDAAGK